METQRASAAADALRASCSHKRFDINLPRSLSGRSITILTRKRTEGDTLFIGSIGKQIAILAIRNCSFPCIPGGGGHFPSLGLDRLRSPYCDELALRCFTTSKVFTTCRTFGTPLATFPAAARVCSVFTSPLSVTTPFFTS